MMELTLNPIRAAFSCCPSSSSSSSSSSPESLALRGRRHSNQQCLFGLFSQSKRPRQLGLYQTGYMSPKEHSRKVSSYWKQQTNVVEQRSIEEVYDSLAKRLLPAVETMEEELSAKYLIGLAGPPGAGKSTLASEVVRRLNKLWFDKTSREDSLAQADDVAIMLPMDGFHLYRSQLDAMENPEEAHARRGAPWTFNPNLLLKCLHALRQQGSVHCPSFDHGVGDPVENDIFVTLQHKIVIVEGNYLLLEEGLWKEISSIFDEKWFLDVDLDTAMQRVVKRHISTGKKADVAKWRIDYNDRPNAELIMQSKKNADLVIKSVDFQC